jgi:hypothetical protein
MHQPRISFFHSFLMTMLLAWGAVSSFTPDAKRRSGP